MDDATKFLLVIFAILAIVVVAVAAMNAGAGSGAVSTVGAVSGSGPAYLPGTLGRGCGI